MTLRPVLRRALLGIGAVVLVSVIAYAALFRPWQRRWDGTPAELALLLPGDSIVTGPVHVTTRAITIGAPPDLVWPWLVQMGNRRGGLYSYDLLDRWFGVLEGPSADSILPQFQGLRAGDTIPIGSGPGWPVGLLEPRRTLLIHVRDADVHVTWLFELLPRGRDSTRLVTRVRASARLTLGRRMQLLLLDPMEFLMVRRMLLGLRTRAEGLARRRGNLTRQWQPTSFAPNAFLVQREVPDPDRRRKPIEHHRGPQRSPRPTRRARPRRDEHSDGGRRDAPPMIVEGGVMRTGDVSRSIRDLLPAIRSRREEIERARRMPRDLVDALRATGLFGLGVPRAIGGREAPPVELMQAIETVATADGSAGWCAMVATANNVAAGYMNEAGAREVFADPTAPSAGIAAPAGAAVREDGGLRVSGRWPFASGITHCDWVWAGCLVMEDGRPRMTPAGPEIVHVCMPVREVEVHDTWHVSGLCGTGSHDFSAAGVFVPAQRTFALLDPSGHRTEPLYQMPPLHLFVFQLVSVSLGIARGALDELATFAQTKTPTLYTAPLADKAVVQVDLARAEAALGGARAFLYDTAEDMWQTVQAGRAPTARQLALGRVAATQAAATAATVTRTANTLAGGSAIYATSSLQRHARDAEAITHHFTVAPHTWEEAGRVLLGRAPTIPVF